MEKRFYMKTEETSMPSYVRKTSNTSRIVFVIIFLFMLIVLVLLGLYFLGAQSLEQEQQVNQPTPAIALEVPEKLPTSIPTPTPVPNRSELSVTILNGSGLPGVAGEMSAYLEGLGYTIERTGNAGRFDYTGVTVQVSEEKKEYLSLLETDLAEKFASVSASISATQTIDAEVVVGQ